MEEYIYPLESLNCFVSDKLNVYSMTERGEPNLDLYSHVSYLASDWVHRISNDDDTLLTELIYWYNRL
jgi:hypothetical protein